MVIQNMETLSVISKLLQVREETLRLALTTRTSKAGGADLFVTPYKMEEVSLTHHTHITHITHATHTHFHFIFISHSMLHANRVI